MLAKYSSLLKKGVITFPNASENLTAKNIPAKIPARPINLRIKPSLKPSINPITKKIIMEYLPKQLSEDEINEIVKKIAGEIGAKGKEDFGKLMPAAMKELKGKADGKIVKSIVEKLLGIN